MLRVYRLNPVVAVEHFGRRSLALHCVDLRLVELNATARDLLSRFDGKATLDEISAGLARDYGQTETDAISDIRAAADQLLEVGILEAGGETE
jgi:hypothetical protein